MWRFRAPNQRILPTEYQHLGDTNATLPVACRTALGSSQVCTRDSPGSGQLRAGTSPRERTMTRPRRDSEASSCMFQARR